MSAEVKRPVQAYKTVRTGAAPDNPYPNAASGAAAILAIDPNWRSPMRLEKGETLGAGAL